jgi:glycosyltransferase involved in cell wall biosynthesis
MKRVLYVYYGTLGLAGAYIHAIAEAVEHIKEIECYFAVSRYYRFTEKRGKLIRIFFPFTDLSRENPFLRTPIIQHLRLPIRYIELVLAYLFILIFSIVRHIDIVNLSLIDDEIPTLLFAFSIKLLRKRLFITAHDSIPYGSRVSMGRRRYIFELADKIIVHHDHVAHDLINHFGLSTSKVLIHPYPWSDVTSIIEGEVYYNEALQKVKDMAKRFHRVFLFIGVLRPEKGLLDLIDAWRVASINGQLLIIAGKPVAGFKIDRMIGNLSNIKIIARYLYDEEFWAFMKMADVVVLPYSVEYYAHSSVILMAFLASKCVVVSDIPLFNEWVAEDNGYKFKRADINDLARVLLHVANESSEIIRLKGECGRRKFATMQAKLPSALVNLYNSYA